MGRVGWVMGGVGWVMGRVGWVMGRVGWVMGRVGFVTGGVSPPPTLTHLTKCTPGQPCWMPNLNINIYFNQCLIIYNLYNFSIFSNQIFVQISKS